LFTGFARYKEAQKLTQVTDFVGGFVEASLQAEFHNYKTPLRGVSLVFA